MTTSLFRLRRAMTLSSSILNRRLRPLSSFASPVLRNPSLPAAPSSARTFSFRPSAALSDRKTFDDGGKISPDEILFEGCDYNHWLITIDFPKDPKPTAEEMVETYVQTAAKVFGSVEEAKKRIYACSTTTYNGFQAIMDEETSEKFRGLPGVVFILPDSYIDPVNKEYGGDKYENGVITPRPPPVQYGRQGRYGDRNRNNDRPRYDRPRDSMQQGNPPQDGRGYAQEGGRDFGAGRRDGYQGNNFAPGNFPPQERRNLPQGQGGIFSPPEQRNFPQGQEGNFPSQEHRNFPQGQRGNFIPQEQRNFPQGQGGNFPPQGQGSFTQAQGGNFPPQEQRNFVQGQGGNFPPQEQRNFAQGQGGDYRSGPGGYRQGPAPSYGGDFRQSSAPGFSGEYKQGPGTDYNSDNRQGTGLGYAGDSRQGQGFGEERSSAGPVEGQWQAKY
ncbi:multiple organellar RNA editing factor 1, mitochondrial-like [Iris pallida]|uniref:Multiple organellar RNA editing factor 1, mitochondrial-like n=1 Tax=Iris pallida TaxID=29817 RepID=A0AAX6EPB5_IRIPA|nr:multiple organellar RNA editing factor 1, mitochondrial-like [Iris pallida]